MTCAGCSHRSYFEEIGAASATETTGTETTEKSADPKRDERVSRETERTTGIFVQVAGAVKKPGVYELAQGSRVFEALEMAGGLKKSADDSELNQAAPLEDGQKLYIYTCEEMEEQRSREEDAGGDSDGTTDGDGSSSEDDKVNINTADVAELTTLSGIGESKASAIISYRESNGGFSKPEDILNVDGIAEGTFNKIKDQIKV